MNPFILQMVNHKLNTITKHELIQYAHQYQFSISDEQATKIIQILRSETIDISNIPQRNRILNKVQQQIDEQTKQQVNALLKQYEQYL